MTCSNIFRAEMKTRLKTKNTGGGGGGGSTISVLVFNDLSTHFIYGYMASDIW